MPQSAKLRIIWNAVSKQWRIFYGLNGDEPTSELSRSKQRFYVQQPMGQSTAVHIMVGHGSADIDRFEIRPLRAESQIQAGALKHAHFFEHCF